MFERMYYNLEGDLNFDFWSVSQRTPYSKIKFKYSNDCSICFESFIDFVKYVHSHFTDDIIDLKHCGILEDYYNFNHFDYGDIVNIIY